MAELRRVVGAVYCSNCAVETLPLKNGTCAWCDKQLTSAGLAQPLAPPSLDGFCDFCGDPVAPSRGRARKFCSVEHKQAHWVRYTPKGREWMARQALRRAK